MEENRVINYRWALIQALLFTLMIELLCVVLRFGFDMTSAEQTRSIIGLLTFGLRIHHGYIGVLMMMLWPAIKRIPHTKISELWMASGISLVISDLIHHFLVLWPITGSPQFDLVYHY